MPSIIDIFLLGVPGLVVYECWKMYHTNYAVFILFIETTAAMVMIMVVSTVLSFSDRIIIAKCPKTQNTEEKETE